MMALMMVSEGTSIVTETVFENRFMHVEEFQKMNAHIKVDGRTAIVSGGTQLTGAKVTATDLRAGAALVCAALCADGESEMPAFTTWTAVMSTLRANWRRLARIFSATKKCRLNRRHTPKCLKALPPRSKRRNRPSLGQDAGTGQARKGTASHQSSTDLGLIAFLLQKTLFSSLSREKAEIGFFACASGVLRPLWVLSYLFGS